MAIWGAGGGSGSSGPTGYDYVQTGQPGDPSEGETWYDVDGDSAYVFDGAAWVEMTVTDHAQLANVTASQHHSRPSGTQSTSQSGGQTHNAIYVENGSKTIPVAGMVDYISYSSDNSSGYDGYSFAIEIRGRAGETVWSDSRGTLNDGNSFSNSKSFSTPVPVYEIDLEAVGSNSGVSGSLDTVSFEAVPGHSHNI